MPDSEEMPADAVILYFEVPCTRSREFVQTYRVARRPQMSHPIVNAEFRFRIDERGHVQTSEAAVVYGGLDTMIWRAIKTEQFLSGKPIDEKTLRGALAVLKEEVRQCTSSQHARRRGRNQQGVPLSAGGELLLQVRPARRSGRRSEAGCRGKYVSRESPCQAAVVGDAGVHRISATISCDAAHHQASGVCSGLG